MNIFKELEEIGEMQENIKFLQDNILDIYKKNPKECNRILLELNDINIDLEDIKTEFLNIKNEIY